MKARHHPEDDIGFAATLPQMITIDTLADILGMSKRTVWRLLAAGRIPAPVRLGGSTRWRLDEVRQWINSGCRSNDYSRES